MNDARTGKEAAQWDAFVLAHGGGFLQSSGWSDFQEALGRRVIRASVAAAALSENASANAAQAQFLALSYDLPFGQRYLYVPRGPILVAAGTDSGDAFAICAREIVALVAAERAAFARVELPYRAEACPVSADALVNLGFRKARTMQPEHTSIVDLSKPEDALLAAMHPKTRYNVRVAERHGVAVREAAYEGASGEEDFARFWKLLSDTAERDAFHTHVRGYYKSLLDTLAPGRSQGALKVRLWFAEHDGTPAAAALVAEFGGTATYLHGASAHAKRQFMAPYFLHWSIMRAAKSAGLREYDFWGVAPKDDDKHPWAGITRFKAGFGGEYVEYAGAWELPGNLFWYTLYRYSRYLRGK